MDDEQEVPGPWRADESTLYFSAHSADYVGLHNQSLARVIASRHNIELRAQLRQADAELTALRRAERTLRDHMPALARGDSDAWWTIDADLAAIDVARGKEKT